MNENELSNKIIGIAIHIHKSLGPGLLESAYKECLYYRLKKEGYFVEKEKPMPWFLRRSNLNADIELIFWSKKKLLLKLKVLTH